MNIEKEKHFPLICCFHNYFFIYFLFTNGSIHKWKFCGSSAHATLHTFACVFVCPAVSLWTWRHFSLFQKTLQTGPKIGKKKGRNRLFVIIIKRWKRRHKLRHGPPPWANIRSVWLAIEVYNGSRPARHPFGRNSSLVLFFFFFSNSLLLFLVFFDQKGNGKETISRFSFWSKWWWMPYFTINSELLNFLSQPIFDGWCGNFILVFFKNIPGTCLKLFFSIFSLEILRRWEMKVT